MTARAPMRPMEGPPKLDAKGLVILPDELRDKAVRMGLVLTEPPGSVRPCNTKSHEPDWIKRPWPNGDLHCPACHPTIAMLDAEGYPNAKPNLAPAPDRPKHIVREKWEAPSSDLAHAIDPTTTLFGDEP